MSQEKMCSVGLGFDLLSLARAFKSCLRPKADNWNGSQRDALGVIDLSGLNLNRFRERMPGVITSSRDPLVQSSEHLTLSPREAF